MAPSPLPASNSGAGNTHIASLITKEHGPVLYQTFRALSIYPADDI